MYVNGDPVNLVDPTGHNPCAYEEGGCDASTNRALAASDRNADISGPLDGRRTYAGLQRRTYDHGRLHLVELNGSAIDIAQASYLTRVELEAEARQIATDDAAAAAAVASNCDHWWSCAWDGVTTRVKYTASALGSAIRTPSYFNPLYDLVNAYAAGTYGVYYISYRTLSTIGSLPGGRVITSLHPISTLYAAQAAGLKGDEAIDAFKNWFFNNGEITRDEGGPIYPTPIHAGPVVYGPGAQPSGRDDLYPQHSYPWEDGFSSSRDPNQS